MRIRVLADLHREFGHVELPEVDADIVVLAGDTDRGVRGVRWAIERFSPTPVLYIAGNHEFYGETFEKVIPALREAAAGTSVHILENDVFEFGRYRFFGATLWTNFALFPDQRTDAMFRASDHSSGMNDYKKIRNSARGYKKLSPRDTRLMHLASMEAIAQFLQSHDPKKSVVVTHHAPSIRSLPERRHAELISCAYASHLDDFVLKHQPQLWIHGHIHHSADYRIGDTRVLSNPRAYPDSPNKGFVSDLVVSLD